MKKQILSESANRVDKTHQLRKAKQPQKTPYTHKPEDMSLEQWQIALRREYGLAQKLKMENIGDDPVFSEFAVTNPISRKKYRVVIRGGAPGHNYCSCPDFSVNTLGTCKHIEFVLAKIMKKRATRALLQAGYHPPFAEIHLKYGSKREVRFQPGVRSSAELIRQAGRYFDGNDVLRPEVFAKLDAFRKIAEGMGEEVRCYKDAQNFIGEAMERAGLLEKIDKFFPGGDQDPAFEKLLRVFLFPYQRTGALFAAKTGRCLIADEMGLGKTIQAIAAAEILARAAGIRRVLVVAPSSLKHQWQQEIEKFSGRSALIIQGTFRSRAAGYAADSFFKITNYDVIPPDMQLISSWSPDLIVLDEAQRIKNWKTKTAQSVKQLRSQYAMVLTGTPLENRLEELHSIVQFVDFFHLGPLFRFLNTHQQVDEHGKVTGYRNLSVISESLESILLRRTKAEVLSQLPERLEKKIFIEMTELQWRHHQGCQKAVAEIVAKWRRLRFLSEKDKHRLMCALQEMRMVCNSTYLVDPETDVGNKIPEVAALLDEVLERPEEKIVIFSQWLRSHELLIRHLEKRGFAYSFFHGDVSLKRRHALVQRFKEDPACRLFLATDAGGVGLNLQNASVVINVDQPWNPAVLEQRIGRVHRFGQQRTVRVIHFIAQNTIEHNMLSRLAFKKELFKGVLDGGQDEVSFGGTRLNQFMESVEKITNPEKEDFSEFYSADLKPDRKQEKNSRTGKVSLLQFLKIRWLGKVIHKPPLPIKAAEKQPRNQNSQNPKSTDAGMFSLPRRLVLRIFTFIKSLRGNKHEEKK
jgi:superfamily II DNA or RNA helicase